MNIRGRLVRFERPAVMGIVNVTDDSFYAGSRATERDAIARRLETVVSEGADIVDIGACSTRPGSQPVDSGLETERLAVAVELVRQTAGDIPVSVDTYRADVARILVGEVGADIVNDISGGTMDAAMLQTVADLGCPYVLMHMRGIPADMQTRCDYADVTAGVLAELADSVARAALAGVNDIIIDPGLGFAKTLEQNYRLLHDLQVLKSALRRPLLVGASRKSMITKALGISADEALNGTTAVNTLALDRGADILRVHDVRAARQAVDLYMLTATGGAQAQTGVI